MPPIFFRVGIKPQGLWFTMFDPNSSLVYGQFMSNFVSETVVKRDIFSESHKGHLNEAKDVAVMRRIVSAAPWWSRPLAWFLARREIRALKALENVARVPNLISRDKDGLIRSFTQGAPLHLARPSDRQFYTSAAKLLRDLRLRNVTHNDLAKPQNWLQALDGKAALIDFQLASVHRHKNWWFRVLAYEDMRHLIKQKNSFAPHLMTPTAKRILTRRTLPSKIWFATFKPVYNAITRGVFNWSDGEGTKDRITNEGDAICEALKSSGLVSEVVLTHYPLPKKGVGIYAFVEADPDPGNIEQVKACQTSADLVHIVSALPRNAHGVVREDLLAMIAMNQISEVEEELKRTPHLDLVVRPLLDNRLNMTDRRISRLEQ